MNKINNLKLKILSIFLAFFTWITVVNLSNPEVVGKREVPLEILNANVLTDAKRTYEINGKNTVTVYFDVRTRDEYKIRSSDFRAYVDLAELYDVTGSVQVKVEILNNKELIDSAEAKPGVVRVNTEELQTKVFDLAVNSEGQAAEGYALNGVTLTPSTITVQGPVSKVGLISYAGVEIDMAGASSNVKGVATPVFYDANGNALVISGISVNTTEVQYEMIINKVKELPLDFEVSGKVASGYRFTGVECATKNISVLGLKSNLAEINKITIPSSALNVDGATADKVVTVDIREFLPDGVDIVESVSPELEVRLKVEKLVDRTVSLSARDVALINASDSYNYRFIPARVEVVVQGLEEDLEQMDGGDLGASVNVAGMEIGPHGGMMEFTDKGVFEVLSVAEFQVDVTGKVGVVSDRTEESAFETAGAVESSDETKEELTTESDASEDA
ncbi:MAG: YbbR-like domain-containing protein [Brotaphodocola sp.]